MRGVDLSPRELEAICVEGHVVQRKQGAPAVIVHGGELGRTLVTKLWTRRRRPSSDWIYPYHTRFRVNAAELNRRGVVAPHVERCGRIRGTNLRYATYAHIAGESLRAIGEREGRIDLAAFATFVARLHERGIYFRALHLGNVLRNEAGEHAVVDVSGVTFKRTALSLRARARNLGILFAYSPDVALLEPRALFFERYRAASTSPDGYIGLEPAVERACARRGMRGSSRRAR